MKKFFLPLILLVSLQASWLESLGDFAKSYTNPSAINSANEQNAIMQTLEIGVKKAISALGKKNGFYSNPLVKISLPENLQTVASTLRKAGLDKYVDELELSMNRAAEEAVPETAEVLLDTIKNIKPQDAKNLIMSDKKDAITQYFKTHAGDKLVKKITPIIEKYMEKEQVNKYYQTVMNYYNKYAPNITQNTQVQAALGAFGISSPKKVKEQDITSYIANRTLDGLYAMIAKEETAIRTNPTARTTKLLKEVFGAK